MHISKEGDPYLRTLLVQGAQHLLGPQRNRANVYTVFTVCEFPCGQS
jgi:hypothetical protein